MTTFHLTFAIEPREADLDLSGEDEDEEDDEVLDRDDEEEFGEEGQVDPSDRARAFLRCCLFDYRMWGIIRNWHNCRQKGHVVWIRRRRRCCPVYYYKNRAVIGRC